MGVLILPIHDLPLQLGFNQLTGLLPAAWSSSNVRPPVELPLIGELGWAIEVSKPKPVLSLNARYRATCRSTRWCCPTTLSPALPSHPPG